MVLATSAEWSIDQILVRLQYNVCYHRTIGSWERMSHVLHGQSRHRRHFSPFSMPPFPLSFPSFPCCPYCLCLQPTSLEPSLTWHGFKPFGAASSIVSVGVGLRSITALLMQYLTYKECFEVYAVHREIM